MPGSGADGRCPCTPYMILGFSAAAVPSEVPVASSEIPQVGDVMKILDDRCNMKRDLANKGFIGSEEALPFQIFPRNICSICIHIRTSTCYSCVRHRGCAPIDDCSYQILDIFG
ncbi:unnamed protein product [Allacma fusca]|uniref:Uncharacterized protein n=1 Tax=Allacma fusca TaxID=39272 RepID=A0A8J2LQA4_9HEXA|nr:unnamed protein product [Allacma fusca]